MHRFFDSPLTRVNLNRAITRGNVVGCITCVDTRAPITVEHRTNGNLSARNSPGNFYANFSRPYDNISIISSIRSVFMLFQCISIRRNLPSIFKFTNIYYERVDIGFVRNNPNRTNLSSLIDRYLPIFDRTETSLRKYTCPAVRFNIVYRYRTIA